MNGSVALARYSAIRCTPSNNISLTRVHTQNAISIGSAVLAQLTAKSPYIYLPKEVMFSSLFVCLSVCLSAC